MARKKQIYDKDGQVVYPDVGLNLDEVIYGDDPTEPVDDPEPWIEPSDFNFRYMMAYGTSGDFDINANNIIPLSASKKDSSNMFSLVDSHIVIGSGVKKILATANIFYPSRNNNAYSWARIEKNNASITNPDTATIANVTNSSYCSVTIAPVIIDVQQGDIISLKNLDNAKIRGYNTWLTVIAVG